MTLFVTKAESLLFLCEDPAYDDATHDVLTAKTKISSHKTSILDLQKMAGLTNDPDKKRSYQERIEKHQAIIKNLEYALKEKQAKLQRASEPGAHA